MIQAILGLVGFINFLRFSFNLENQQNTHRNLLISFVFFSFGAFGLSVACAEVLLSDSYLHATETGSGAGLWSILFSIRVVFLLLTTSSEKFQEIKEKGRLFNSLLFWAAFDSVIIFAEFVVKIISSVAIADDESILVAFSALFTLGQFIVLIMICCSACVNRTTDEEGFLYDETKQSIRSCFNSAVTNCIGHCSIPHSSANNVQNSTHSTTAAVSADDVPPDYNDIQEEETDRATDSDSRPLIP